MKKQLFFPTGGTGKYTSSPYFLITTSFPENHQQGFSCYCTNKIKASSRLSLCSAAPSFQYTLSISPVNELVFWSQPFQYSPESESPDCLSSSQPDTECNTEKNGNISPEAPFPDRIHGYPPATCGFTKGKNGFRTGLWKEYCSSQNRISQPEHLPYNKKGMVRLRISPQGCPSLPQNAAVCGRPFLPSITKSFRSFWGAEAESQWKK